MRLMKRPRYEITTKKSAALALAVVYFHVNVVFAAAPQTPLVPAVTNVVGTLLQKFHLFRYNPFSSPKNDKVFVFHSQWDDMMRRLPETDRNRPFANSIDQPTTPLPITSGRYRDNAPVENSA